MRKLVLVLLGILVLSGQLLAQSRTVTGRVTDASGSPIANASVLVKGTTVGTTTGEDGNFSLTLPENARVLVFSAIGTASQEITIGNRGLFNITMSADDKDLQEVVVVGYGAAVKRKEITGNIATVKGDAIANRPVQSFDQALGGRAPGVQITIPSGVLNAPPVFRVRGTNSISLSSQPLIVVDGIPMFSGDASSTSAAGNALASINPNDIESIDIAKDAAASAIYGSRASNGVIFITTKKGKSGRPRVNLDSWVGWTSVQRLPSLLDAFQYTEYKNQSLTNAGLLSPTNRFDLTEGPDGQPINTNWYDYVYRTGFSHNNSLSLSGGNEATKYYTSIAYTEQEGIIKRNDFKRLTAVMNVDHKINKAISLGSKIQYSSEKNLSAVSSGSLGDAFATAGLGRVPLVTAPNISPYNNDGSYNYSGALIGVMNNKQGQVGFNNPVIQLDQNRGNADVSRLLGNAYIQVKPIQSVAFRSQYSVDYLMVDNEIYYSPISGEGFADGGSATSLFAQNKRWVWSNTLQYDKIFGNNHDFGILVGTEQQKSNNKSYGLNRIGVNDPDFTNIQGGWRTPNTAGLGIGENYLLSYFGRLTYNFDKRYYFSANVRRDGASQLGLNNKWGTFWGASVGWDIDKEKFFQDAGLDNVFSSLRLRGSYGKVGNIDGLGQYASLSLYNSGLYGGNGTFVFSQAGNPDLGWESSTKTDIGINFGLLNDRISGEITYYKNDVNDLILFVPTPPSAGLPSTIPTNIGAMYNKGLEVVLNGTPVQTKDFSWNASFNITFNKNEVTSLAPGVDNIISATGGLESPSITVVGQPLGMLFVTRTNGVDPATGRRIFINGAGQEVYFQHIVPAGSGGARFMFADGTTAPTVSSADAVVYKNTNPKYYGGFDNTFRYKGFELNTLFTFQGGNYVYWGTYAGLRDQRFWNNSTDVLRAWTKPGDVTDMPKSYFGDNTSNGSGFPLDINVFKGDFIKLRTATLAYNLPSLVVNKIKINSLRFYVTGNNLWIGTKYPGPDPEVSSNGTGNTNQGIDRNTVANARGIIVGLNVGF
ncbi:TonB-dependent receptor [Flavihumibacter sp. CACIAM 22H1]|uniref:SusC/RagA family TonB-linked outer membrane protein n=1 Tax=Flavihumibacter sp. CACIAM 22H1 TaxID=1812911 RepID=UPI0007A8CA0D|nr:TonB-dependent receptor [Flavihumibacter sp. CACIAM 22H1]KYP13835.1 MAG: SusC/RagA family TonB-linked outer membrane protein [Flavihumibacter sp. CACIAM 22H1]